MDEIIDLLDIAAKDYPIKALAPEIGKGESTLRNELTQQPGYKLGLITAIMIMKKTWNFRALNKIEAIFNRVAFNLPKPEPGNMVPVMKLLAKISKEYSEEIQEMANALADGVVSGKEARRCLKENKDLIKVCIELQAYLEQIIKIKAI